MITVEESIPTKSNSYLKGQDIFYVQFNDIFFYIEDENQENFFFCILKKLFPSIRLGKIFPLGGKEIVLEESRKNTGNKSKVYIVDKDFDDILKRAENRANLFYLDRYSIENYLIENDSFIEYIISERPRIRRDSIISSFDLDNTILNIGITLRDLIILYILVQQHSLGIKNIDQNCERYINYNGVFTLKSDQFLIYKSEVEEKLRTKDGRLSIERQMKIIKKAVLLESNDSYITHVPGKYLMKMIKFHIEHQLHIPSREIDSFNYRIAEKCSFNSLENFRTKINSFIN
jgi:hypothetical protein